MSSLLHGLPEEIKKKINKTKQTRGAQPYERVPFQNRVNRTGIALVPYSFRAKLHPEGFSDGYRVMVRPSEYFERSGVVRKDFDAKVKLGENAFVYYDNRRAWRELPPATSWSVCEDRTGNGHYLARVPANTANDEQEAREIVIGEPQGIRFFEYASPKDVEHTVAQLAWLAWQTLGIDAVRTDGGKGIPKSLAAVLEKHKLADAEKFLALGGLIRLASGELRTVCPLCRAEIDAAGLMSRVEQMEGREVFDLTITEINLFHLKELRPGEYNHRPYNLAWGHHHCNAVARDNGVAVTVNWMAGVLERHGFVVSKKK
jgi:hypothetical protein